MMQPHQLYFFKFPSGLSYSVFLHYSTRTRQYEVTDGFSMTVGSLGPSFQLDIKQDRVSFYNRLNDFLREAVA